jgi:hypothetical protein
MGGSVSSGVIEDLQPSFRVFTSWNLAKAKAVIDEFKAQLNAGSMDFVLDVQQISILIPDIDEWRPRRIIAALTVNPRMPLVSSMSFLLLLLTLSDAGTEGIDEKFGALFDAFDFDKTGRISLDELNFFLLHLTNGFLGAAGLIGNAVKIDIATQQVAIQAFQVRLFKLYAQFFVSCLQLKV